MITGNRRGNGAKTYAFLHVCTSIGGNQCTSHQNRNRSQIDKTMRLFDAHIQPLRRRMFPQGTQHVSKTKWEAQCLPTDTPIPPKINTASLEVRNCQSAKEKPKIRRRYNSPLSRRVITAAIRSYGLGGYYILWGGAASPKS